MAKKIKDDSTIQPSSEFDPNPPTPPFPTGAVLYLLFGAGKRGKTFLARWIKETCQEHGVALAAIDVEAVNVGLRASHHDCLSPGYAITSGVELAGYLYPIIETAAAEGASSLIDLEGNDARIITLCRETALLELLGIWGVHLIVVAVIGGVADDLAYLAMLVDALGPGSYSLQVVVAERLLPSHKRQEGRIAAELATYPEIAERLNHEDSGIVMMPTCDSIVKLDAVATTYRQAADDYAAPREKTNPLLLFERSLLRSFLRKMARNFDGFVPWSGGAKP